MSRWRLGPQTRLVHSLHTYIHTYIHTYMYIWLGLIAHSCEHPAEKWPYHTCSGYKNPASASHLYIFEYYYLADSLSKYYNITPPLPPHHSYVHLSLVPLTVKSSVFQQCCTPSTPTHTHTYIHTHIRLA